MNDKEIDHMEYVTVRVTPETMDAHVQCLKENGYAIQKKVYVLTTCLMCFVLGLYIMALITK